MSVKTVTLPISGMTCANCAFTIWRTLKKKTDGAIDAAVNLALENARVEYDNALINRSDIISAIEKSGYHVLITRDNEETTDQLRQNEIIKQRIKFLIGLVFILPLFLFSMARA